MITEDSIRLLRCAGIRAATDPRDRERIIRDALLAIEPCDRDAALEILERAAEVIRLAMAPVDRARH
jgi:hypothetical protein